ncbi:hypothetical protein BCR33DRAFT_522918 [Rhizoclosmatium globosum]|uniref:Uncharacterized protein n=1 Tax=Rhizoclosmatium globosum TaxID=329046 RepID=A0A1Y2BDU6_9FUNG|nr:hypothetical protein BCR33DRAFT_522918 [Rhizoclosmatium globosum]|eukprot:ORY32982.1 hypothetical protein BCR33DRAFT_522918 [Rhizoclosmatium globosum]
MRKSSSLLQTLQASGQMIEGLVRSCFRDMQVQYGEKFGAALADLNRRVEVLEGRLGQAGGGSGQSGYGGSSSQGQSQAHGQARGNGVEYSNTGFRGEPMTPAVKPPSLDFPVPAHSSTSTSGSSGSGQQQHSHSDQTPHDVNALLKSLMDRLDQLEKNVVFFNRNMMLLSKEGHKSCLEISARTCCWNIVCIVRF